MSNEAKELRELFTNYWIAKISLRFALPGVPDEDLDRLSAAMLYEEQPKAPTPEKRTKRDGTPALKPGPKGGPKPIPQKTVDPLDVLVDQAVTARKGRGLGKKTIEALTAQAEPYQNSSNLAAEGRRAVMAGERPPLKDAIRQALGAETKSVAEVYEILREKGWLPNSSDPKGYIGYTLSSLKKDFERNPSYGRGFYRVKIAKEAKNSPTTT